MPRLVTSMWLFGTAPASGAWLWYEDEHRNLKRGERRQMIIDGVPVPVFALLYSTVPTVCTALSLSCSLNVPFASVNVGCPLGDDAGREMMPDPRIRSSRFQHSRHRRARASHQRLQSPATTLADDLCDSVQAHRSTGRDLLWDLDCDSLQRDPGHLAASPGDDRRAMASRLRATTWETRGERWCIWGIGLPLAVGSSTALTLVDGPWTSPGAEPFSADGPPPRAEFSAPTSPPGHSTAAVEHSSSPARPSADAMHPQPGATHANHGYSHGL
ncbi:hypothetical protein G7046_g1979 [Stylonectria norvegica]|nr:hypothetical protein G7046_g1979 [Stylonectria norvegica]